MLTGRNVSANHELAHIHPSTPVEVGDCLLDLALGDLLLQFIQKAVPAGELDEIRGGGGEADRVADMVAPQS